jgi:hypothetical protein
MSFSRSGGGPISLRNWRWLGRQTEVKAGDAASHYISALVMETLFAWEPIGAGSVASCDGDEIPEWYKGDEDWSIRNEPRVGKIDTPERGLRLLAFGIRHSARCKITPGVCYPQNPTPNEHLCN